MQEVFYEESAFLADTRPATVKYNVCKVFSIASYVIAITWIVIAINFFEVEGYWFYTLLGIIIPFGTALTSGILLGIIRDKQYIDYDYTFITGTIRISKVIKNVKRRKILSFDTSNIEKIGRYGSPSYVRFSSSPDKKRLVLTSNKAAAEGKDFYYIATRADGQSYLLVLECTDELLRNILRFSGKNAFEDGFFNK